MSQRINGVRRRSLQLALAGAVTASVTIGGVAIAGASPAPAPAAAPAAAAPAVAAIPAAVTAKAPVSVAAGDEMTVTKITAQRGGLLSYDVYYKIANTARYPQTVFSEVTNEGKFARIFPIKGAKANLGEVGTRHPLHVGPVPFPVTVKTLDKTSWRFNTRLPHPDYPGYVKFWLYKKGDMMKLHVRGVCAACGQVQYLAIAYAQWKQFARNIKKNVDL